MSDLVVAELLVHVVTGLALILAAGLLVLFGHWVAASLHAARWRRPIGEADAALRRIVTGDAVASADFAALRRLPFRLQADLFQELAPNLRGEALVRLRGVASRLGMTERAVRMSRSRRWSRRLRAVQLLSALDDGVGALPPLLHDAHPSVRERAVDWAGDHPEPDVIARLLELLEDPREPSRFLAQNALHRMGLPVVEPLRHYLSTRSGAAAIPALELAVETADAALLGPALERAHDEDPRTRVAALRLLSAMGGAEAMREARLLLEDASPAVRAEAATALARLDHWPAAAAIVPLLEDPSWVVRRAAALALRDLGSPGLILLQCAAREPLGEGAALARQVLDLPRDPSWEAEPA